MNEKRHSKAVMAKKVVTKNGKVFGEVANLLFDPRSGELLHLALRNPTGYCDGLDLERTKQNEVMVPFSAVVALGDFVVIAEEDIF